MDKTKSTEAPQTDDLSAIEQWHENQEAEHIAAHGATYNVCPQCEEEANL